MDTPPVPSRERSFSDPRDVDLFVETLGKFERGEIGADAWKAFRLLNGTYGQRQEGDLHMQRVKIPQGALTAPQLEALAEVAERHARGFDEHLRLLAKVDAGCSFLVSQTVYSVTASKDLLSDLVYRCRDEGRDVPIVLVTLSPCGSAKTLAFMRWLGIAVPRWLENELLHAEDTLRASVEVSLAIFEELLAFARSKGIPLGCNVESVSLALAEIDASVEMVHRVAAMMGRG
jgi:hypothetical protein